MLFSLIAVGFILGVLYTTQIHSHTYNVIVDKYRRFRKLNKLVASKYKTNWEIFYHSIELIGRSSWTNLIQWLNGNVKKVDRNLYEITYAINGRLYKMLIKQIRGPVPIKMVLDKDGNDITDKVLPYIGPQHDFHSAELYPNFFSTEKLCFLSHDDSMIEFESDDVLTLQN